MNARYIIQLSFFILLPFVLKKDWDINCLTPPITIQHLGRARSILFELDAGYQDLNEYRIFCTGPHEEEHSGVWAEHENVQGETCLANYASA